MATKIVINSTVIQIKTKRGLGKHGVGNSEKVNAFERMTTRCRIIMGRDGGNCLCDIVQSWTEALNRKKAEEAVGLPREGQAPLQSFKGHFSDMEV